MKWLSVVNFIDSKGIESISVAELILEPWNKKGISIGKNSGIFPGNFTLRKTRRAVEKVLYRICNSKTNPVSVCICGLDGRLESFDGLRYFELEKILPSEIKHDIVQRRSFDGSMIVHYKWVESPGILELMSKINIKQVDLDTPPDFTKIWLFWKWFAHTHRARMQEKSRNNTKFIWVCTPPGSILHQILTERWNITEAFWQAFCKLGYWNVCIKPAWWNQNPPFSDVTAALLADEDDKVTWASPTIVWANKTS